MIKKFVQPHEIRKCNVCGQDIVFLQYASGKSYPADVHEYYPHSKGKYTPYAIVGEGNNNNLKVRHTCEAPKSEAERSEIACAPFRAILEMWDNLKKVSTPEQWEAFRDVRESQCAEPLRILKGWGKL